jgi:alkylation response protein AidB-like acyl-CoA dehydrogenase
VIAPEDFRRCVRTWIAEHRDLAPTPGPFTPQRVGAWRRWSRMIFEAGYAGITWPVEYGGRGLTASHQAVWLEEIGAARVADHLGVVGLGMAGPTIISWGSDEQKQQLLRPILDCSQVWCQGFSEPSTGSDLASVRTFARADGDDWVVDGQKVWSSFAQISDWCLLLVRTDRGVPQHAGMSFLLADLRTPGVEVRPLRQLTGDAEFTEIFFTDARIPRSSMLGRPGDGWRVAMTTLGHERGTYGVGLAASLQAELDTAVHDLQAAGRLDPDRSSVREELAGLWAQVQALIRTNARSLAAIERTGSAGPEATISKLRWSLLNQQLTALVTDELGSRALGAVDGDEVGEHWAYARLRARGNTLEAGTTEILRNIVAERVLGLPRSR